MYTHGKLPQGHVVHLQIEKRLSESQNFSINLAEFLLIPGSVECVLVNFLFLCLYVLGQMPKHTPTYGECLVQPDVKR